MIRRRKIKYNLAGLKCPECNSKRLIRFGRKWMFNKKGDKRILVPQYQCKHCGRITVHPKKVEYD